MKTNQKRVGLIGLGICAVVVSTILIPGCCDCEEAEEVEAQEEAAPVEEEADEAAPDEDAPEAEEEAATEEAE